MGSFGPFDVMCTFTLIKKNNDTTDECIIYIDLTIKMSL